jgi:hypothetical protein
MSLRFRWTGLRLGLLGLAAGIVLTLFVGSGTASAPPCPTTPGGQSCTYSFTGSEQSFTVPAGVTSIHVVAQGGGGGVGDCLSSACSGFFGSGGAAGKGAQVSADLSVSPNEVLYVEVGGAATSSGDCNDACAPFGGFNGGGDGRSNSGGGGGASDLRTTASANAGSLDSRLLVAAGGGGGGAGGADFHNIAIGQGGNGGNAASPGTDGSGCTITGGTGGGAGGTNAGGAAGSPIGMQGSQGTGGSGGGGGGGGGSYGGGSGGSASLGPDPECQTGAGGGGGGSNYTTDPNAVITNDANSSDGQVIISYTVPPTCTQTGYYRDGINLTAKQIGGSVTGTLDATGCNIGVYYGPGTSGTVSGANISGANYYGVVNNAGSVNISTSSIHDIGETQPNGAQHGVGVIYTTLNGTPGPSFCNACVTSGPHATGTLSGSSITNYQKNGVVISGAGAAATAQSNTVTGYGMINYIAQNGIEVASGGTASIMGNTVSGNWYTPTPVVACGLLFIQAGGVKQSGNNLFNNEINLCNAGRGGGKYKP